MSKTNILVVVTGPTASGKTELAVRLAEYFATDVISADSRQIYKDLPIGTAAPSTDERSRAYHHFVGTLELSDYYSAAVFEQEALRLLPGLWLKNKVAVVCGGSMMYIDALCRYRRNAYHKRCDTQLLFVAFE